MAEDPFQREDFNEAFATIDTGYAANAAACEAAQAAAEAAYSPDFKPFATGSYTGTGGTATVELGFRPSFVIIDGYSGTTTQTNSGYLARYRAFTGGNAGSSQVTLTDTGFTVVNDSTYYPSMSSSGRVYDYIAFRRYTKRVGHSQKGPPGRSLGVSLYLLLYLQCNLFMQQ